MNSFLFLRYLYFMNICDKMFSYFFVKLMVVCGIKKILVLIIELFL